MTLRFSDESAGVMTFPTGHFGKREDPLSALDPVTTLGPGCNPWFQTEPN